MGNFELYRKYDNSGDIDVERSTVHISDDTGRIAMLEVLNTDYNSDGAEEVLTRYIYSNHLQSASLELDGNAEIISYEEYHPYGTTSYQAMNASINAVAKRYRYTGKERDEESGLYYHGARYYIPWLGRWSAVDVKQSEMPTWSSYNYGFCNPVKWKDSTGMQPDGEEIKTIFLDRNTGKPLGELPKDKFIEYEKRENISDPEAGINYRLISWDDYQGIINYGESVVQSIDENGILLFKYSDSIKINNEQIVKAFTDAVEKNIRNANRSEREQGVAVILDTDKLEITARHLKDEANSNSELKSENHYYELGNSMYLVPDLLENTLHNKSEGTKMKVINTSSNLVVLARAHTHPENSSNFIRLDNNNTIFSNKETVYKYNHSINDYRNFISSGLPSIILNTWQSQYKSKIMVEQYKKDAQKAGDTEPLGNFNEFIKTNIVNNIMNFLQRH